MKAVISLLVCLVCPGQSHVSLKYPPARDIDLDFLDSVRTSGDCGMEPGEVVTSLEAGSQLNFTWHLGYPHGGGYRLELVDGAGSQVLVPQTGEAAFQVTGGRTAQSAVVTLPDVECSQCYLRFQREATEWGNSYRFRSCADIRLVRALSEQERCSGRGTWEAGSCRCERLREGDRCQYQTQCRDDSDCNGPKGQGQCVAVDRRIFPYSECYCADGWFGAQCQHQARWGPGQARNYNREQFNQVSLGGEVELLWRVEEEKSEVEIIMTAPTLSWLGLGWRPANTEKSCRDFPARLGQYRDRTLHAMDCMDIVVGTARGGLGRVADYYTRDRSTPRLDSVWGGQDDLLSSHAWEEDGRTGMRFVRAISGGDEADHDIAGNMMIIWAHGQQTSFYQEDQLKFHSKAFSGVSAVVFPVLASGWTPVNISILVSCVLIVVLLLIQMCQNCDKKLKFLTPFSYKSFSPEN